MISRVWVGPAEKRGISLPWACCAAAILFRLIVLLFFREPNPKTFILLFVRPNIPLLVSMLLAMASILVLTGLFSMAFISFAWAFYSWVGNALHMLLPWGAHRFRALAMAFFLYMGLCNLSQYSFVHPP